MATTTAKKNTATAKTEPTVKTAATKTETPVKAATVKQKQFKNNDMIPCKSVTSGELLMIGAKSGRLYTWAECDYIEEVEYQDLLYATRSKSGYVMYPRFLIMDEDFVAQDKELSAMYESLYTFNQITDILNLEPERMRQVILGLPSGIQNAIKNVAANRIVAGTYDSVKKIKILDEIFETAMLQTLVDD
jgi:hypothetical protein